MSSSVQTLYMTKQIRDGFEALDVQMWQSLCQQAKTEIGDSVEHLFLIIDMARHNECGVLDIIKTGRVCSGQKAVNEKFIEGLMSSLADGDEVATSHASTRVLDLTCEESDADSGSYEETSQEYNANPTSAEAYEIDGFVVADDDADDKVNLKKSKKLKRRLELVSQE